MDDTNFILSRIDALKKKYPELRNHQDYHLFILLCLKYFISVIRVSHLTRN